MLCVEDLTVELGAFRLEGVDLDLAATDYYVLLGASGAGKTVVLESIAGLLCPSRGRIQLDGNEISRRPIRHRGIGLVYQDRALFPHLSVARNIAYALRGHSRNGRTRRVAELAARVGCEHLLERHPGTLSLGEAQRVALARTLAAEPRLLLLDEPLASLDVRSKGAMRLLLRRLHAAGQPVLHVTHDYEEALALATRVGVLEDGHIAQQGTPDQVFHYPRSDFVAGFVGIRNYLRGKLIDNDAEGESRFVPSAGPILHVSCDEPPGPAGLLIRSEDLILSHKDPGGSLRNRLPGTVVDGERTRRGMEVTVAVESCRLHALVTRRSWTDLDLAPGRPIWISCKSTALTVVPDANQETP